jgi:hypothetical protein
VGRSGLDVLALLAGACVVSTQRDWLTAVVVGPAPVLAGLVPPVAVVEATPPGLDWPAPQAAPATARVTIPAAKHAALRDLSLSIGLAMPLIVLHVRAQA